MKTTGMNMLRKDPKICRGNLGTSIRLHLIIISTPESVYVT